MKNHIHLTLGICVMILGVLLIFAWPYLPIDNVCRRVDAKMQAWKTIPDSASVEERTVIGDAAADAVPQQPRWQVPMGCRR